MRVTQRIFRSTHRHIVPLAFGVLMAPATGILRRLSWGIGDQIFSSATNFAVGIVVARLLGPRDLGGFSVGFAAYLVALLISRAFASEPLTMRYSHRNEQDWRIATSGATGTVLVFAMVCGAAGLVAGAVLGGAAGQALLAVAISLPGLLVQDAYRHAFFAKGTGALAFVNDVIWAAVLFPVLALLAVADLISVFTATAAWGLSASVAAFVGALQARAAPLPTRSPAWLREQRDVIPPLLGEGAMNSSRQLAQFAIAAIAGLAAAGAYRAGDVLLGPLKVLFMGTHMVAQPEAARLYHRAPDRLLRMCLGIGGVLGVAATLVGVGLALLPDSVGEAVLGASWVAARPVVFPIAITLAGSGFAAGAFVGLRGMGIATRSFRARLIESLLHVGFAIVGAAVGGVTAAAWGIAAATWVAVAIWWRELLAALAYEATLPKVEIRPDAEASAVSGGRVAK